jgi:predicted double-glycine peptidase
MNFLKINKISFIHQFFINVIFFVLFTNSSSYPKNIYGVDNYMQLLHFCNYRQQSEITCGMAVLSTLFTCFFKDTVSESNLMNIFFPIMQKEHRNFSFYDMYSFSKSKGYNCGGFKTNLQGLLNLLDSLPVPIILHLHLTSKAMYGKSEETNGHFVLAILHLGNYIYVKDPAIGNRVISLDKLISVFSGNIFIIAPNQAVLPNSNINDIKSISLNSLVHKLKFIERSRFDLSGKVPYAHIF